MPRRILASRAFRFSKSQRSCSSWVSSKRSNTSSTLLEPVAWSCFWILACKVASRISIFILSSSPDFIGEPTEHLLARYHFNFAGSNLVDPALDFVGPSLLDAFFGWPFVEALDQAINQQTAFLAGRVSAL